MCYQEGKYSATGRNKLASLTEASCAWSDLFQDNDKIYLLKGLVVLGLIYAALATWLNCHKENLVLKKKDHVDSIKMYKYFLSATYIRVMLPFVSRFGFVKKIVQMWFDSCQFFAFWDTFMTVFEIESLTHICIERYVVAKYITKGWPIQKKHYSLYFYLCLMFAALYSCLPLFGLGRYGYDFACSSCTFDIVLPDTWQRYPIVTVFFLRSVKPAMFMITMLIWARRLENKFDSTMKKKANLHYTQIAIVITVLNLMCWMPLALIKGWVISYQLLYNELSAVPSRDYIRWALWIYALVPTLSLAAMCLEDRVRRICFPGEVLQHPAVKQD